MLSCIFFWLFELKSEEKHTSKKFIRFLNLEKRVYFHKPRTSLTGFKVLHNHVFSWLSNVKILDRVKKQLHVEVRMHTACNFS